MAADWLYFISIAQYYRDRAEVERLTIRAIKLRQPRVNAVTIERILKGDGGRWYVTAKGVHADTLDVLSVKLSVAID
jgi:hypothetical protein